jgi:hypothetical protein
MKTLNRLVIAGTLLLGMSSFASGAEKVRCQFNELQTSTGFTKVSIQCENGYPATALVGSSDYVSCRPDQNLANFTSTLSKGEMVELVVTESEVTTIDGSSRNVRFIESGISETGKVLSAPTFIYHKKPKQCRDTQIEVQ